MNSKKEQDYLEKIKELEIIIKTLQKKHEEYVLHSIWWGAEDFTSLEKEGWQITEEQAENACLDMIHNHDCEYGITWDSVDFYYEQYGEEVEEGKEAWRALYEENEE